MNEELNDTEALAAEYVLGTLEPAERRRVERLLARDAAFTALVDEWIRRLAPLSETVPPETPPPEVWQRIQVALRQRRAALAQPRQIRRARPPRLTERLSFWRWCTVGASAVAAVLALYIVAVPLAVPPEPQGQYVAVLNRGEAEPAWLVTVDLENQALTIRPVAEVGVAEQSLELWLIAGDQPAPRSLGLLSPEQPVSLVLPAVWQADEPAPAVLAVSLEPLGGSPTGAPTGPVLYQGSLLPVSDE